MAPIDLWGAPLNESLQIKHSKRSSASTFRVVSFGAGGFTGELISAVKQASQKKESPTGRIVSVGTNVLQLLHSVVSALIWGPSYCKTSHSERLVAEVSPSSEGIIDFVVPSSVAATVQTPI